MDDPPLRSPGLPRLELDRLLGQLVERAHEVIATRGHLRGLLRANQMITGDLALPVLLRHIDTARELVGARYAALGVNAGSGGPARFVHAGMSVDTVESVATTSCSRRPWGRPPTTGRVAVMICYDLEFPEFVRLAAQDGAEIVAVPANWPWLPRPPGERPLEVIRAQAVAGAYRVHVVVADRCGVERGVDWIGGSIVCASTGYLLAGPATPTGGSATDTVLTAELDPASARNKSIGTFNHALADRRPALYLDRRPESPGGSQWTGGVS